MASIVHLVKFLICMLTLTGFASGAIYSVENADGSYSIGTNSDSHGQSANSILALLNKSTGYTADIEDIVEQEQPADDFSAENRIVLQPHLEVLQLVESFLRLKGELAGRVHAVVADNYDIIRSLYQTLISKIGGLHSFTLIGVRLLRKILEFAATLMAQWQVSVSKPGFAFDFNAAAGARPQGHSADYSSSFYDRK